MLSIIKYWFYRYFSDPQAALLVILLVSGFVVLMTMGRILAPVLASVVIAYLLDGLIFNMERWQIRRPVGLLLVYSVFITLLTFSLIVLLPLLAHQLSQFVEELPNKISQGQAMLMELPKQYPTFISTDEVDNLISAIHSGVRDFGQDILSYSLASIPAFITLMVYLVLVPILVFFFLKDKNTLLAWFVGFLPRQHTVVAKLWKEMNTQIGNYVRGKVYEAFIIGIVTYIPFVIMGMNYSLLLAVLVGLSVFIPYIGGVVVTLPVIFVAYFQWGWNSEFVWLMTIYTILQLLDANILVPLLFAEAVSLHPVAIIMSVLVFGGFWGFWGVFFAIPLASLVKALLETWPRATLEMEANSD